MMSARTLTTDDIHRVCGDISDRKVLEILGCGGDIDALEEAWAWAMGDDESTPSRHFPPGSPATCILEILIAGDEPDELESNRSG